MSMLSSNNINFSTLMILNDPNTRQVLKVLLQKKSSSLKELTSESLPKAEVLKAIHQLKTHELVKESSASIEDLATYYVTAQALRAERELKGL